MIGRKGHQSTDVHFLLENQYKPRVPRSKRTGLLKFMLSASHPLRITLTLFTSYSPSPRQGKKITFGYFRGKLKHPHGSRYKSNAPLPLAPKIAKTYNAINP